MRASERAEAVDPARLAAAEPFCRAIHLQLAKGHYQAALRTISEAQAELERVTGDPLSASLHAVMPEIMANRLRDALGMETVADLERFDAARLLAYRNVGPATVDAVVNCLLRLLSKGE